MDSGKPSHCWWEMLIGNTMENSGTSNPLYTSKENHNPKDTCILNVQYTI